MFGMGVRDEAGVEGRVGKVWGGGWVGGRGEGTPRSLSGPATERLTVVKPSIWPAAGA